ncbi:hypothetical protein K491DRAFT_606176 [Lophiostoma macrostomum CBS 122681]|uniref:N-acetyltransferase domain-containing protein n=1 Tax=Lophiostoma macrostomum CBS 122681 TaxID=1314788 RepID=A0A6A6SXN2_9PLEO|nr:hypothetical protein K491DRAFT_606176 [Lophiostoma macrostomum CBS 122681]
MPPVWRLSSVSVSKAMSFETKEVRTKSELDAIVDVIWAAMEPEPSHASFFPIVGSRELARERAIEESKSRLWHGHEMDSSSHWIYVTELEDGKQSVVGGCQWRIYDTNPFPDPDARINATWWPEGSTGRAFASEVASQCHQPRKAWMACPHAGITLMSVLPEKQRQGVGSQLMEWGLEQMNDRDIEGFVEASPSGRQLYLKHGFVDVAYVRVKMDHDDLSLTDVWKELEKNYLPVDYTAMWRPKGGHMPRDEMARIWKEKLKVPVKNHVEGLI